MGAPQFTAKTRQKALKMHADGFEPDEIAEALHITTRQAHHLVRWRTDKSVSPLVALLATLGHSDDKNKTDPPPARVIQEAIAREFFPRTSTMQICGDPVLEQCTVHPHHFQRVESRA